MEILKLVLMGSVLSGFVDSDRILGAFIFPSYSHQIIFQAIYKELALRGHQVVVITTDPLKDLTVPNLHEIDVSVSYETWRNRTNMVDIKSNPSGEDVFRADSALLSIIAEQQLSHPEVQKLLSMKGKHFDLVLVEWINPIMFAFSAKFKCPLIGISTVDLMEPLSDVIGNPSHPVLNPNMFLPYTNELTFWERIFSTKFSIWMRYFYHYELFPLSDTIIRKYFGGDMPPVLEIAKNVSMIFVNANPLLTKPRPTVPAVVEFSGIHVQSVHPLPKDIKEFLDDAPHGAIYFSLGSNIKSYMLSEKLKLTVLQTLSQLPYRVLWKFDNHSMTNLSDNIKIVKWVPQQDVLAHPNIKLFIMQGGLQSLEEAIRRRIPLVGMPFFIDQPKNVKKMVDLGIGLDVDKATLTKDSFRRTIIEVAENKQYRQKIEELSDLLDDQPMASLDKVIWWIEYVIRHKGAKHLRSPYADIPWYKFFLLDILLLVISCVIIVILVIMISVKHFLEMRFKIRKVKLE